MDEQDIVLNGIDTLAVGFIISEYTLEPEEWQGLAYAKESAQERLFSSEGSSFTLRGHEFSVARKGSRGYEYILTNDDVTVQIAPRADGGASYPEVRVTFRSTYLWRYGWRAAFRKLEKWVSSWAEIAGDKVSRVDLMVDIATALPEINFRSREVVSRAKIRSEFFIQRHLKGLQETGYSFGKGEVMCRLYDKRAEIEHSQKVWFEDMWRQRGWDGQAPVTRVEFQMRRKFLGSMQIDTVKDLERQLGDLWRYLTDEWLQLKEADRTDSNHSRWQPKAFWKVAMGAVAAFGIVTGVARITQRRPRLDSLQRLARGVAVSLVATMATTFPDEPLQAAVRQYQRMSRAFLEGPAFEDAVGRRAAGLAML